MAEMTSFAAEPRPDRGRGAARASRRKGRVPANIYGDSKDNLAVTLDAAHLSRDLNRPGFGNRLCEIAIDGQKLRVLPREVQLDPVSDKPVHVDFLRLSPTSRV